MESNQAQYPYLPLPSQEPLISYTPYTPIRDPPQEYQPARYPSFDQPQPQPQYIQPAYPENELKFQHLNALCSLHLYPLDTVCRAPDCARRLLCRQCAVEHRNHFEGHEKTFGSLLELLDDSMAVELDDLVREEQITLEVAEERCEVNSCQRCQRVNSPLENFKAQMSEMMDRVQKEAGKVGDWFTEKQNMIGMEWDNLRREYLEKKRRFLEARPGCGTVELAQLVEVVNKIKEKQCKVEKKVQKEWEKQTNKINKFVMKLQEKSRKLQEKGAKKFDKKMKKVEKFWRELGF